jgi:hypothetical protein
MRLLAKIALVTGVLALAIGSVALAAGKPEGDPPYGSTHANEHSSVPEYAPAEEPTPGPKAGLPEKAKAYGRNCKGESRKHVTGEKGTPFSRCVTQMAQAATHPNMAPGRVCKEESRKHVKGEKGTPFSQCVRRVVKMRHEERKQEEEQEEAEETSTETASS